MVCPIETMSNGLKLGQIANLNIYEENWIVIFKRSTGEFMTFCEPNDDEQEDLLEIGNFGVLTKKLRII